MSIEMPGLRPAVISSALKEELEEYRGFRHVVRNIYAYRFNPEKIAGLVTKLDRVFSNVEEEVTAFAQFLQSVD